MKLLSRTRCVWLPALALGVATGTAAAPVSHEDIAPDAYELALQWTLASITPAAAWAPGAAATPPAAPGAAPGLSGAPLPVASVPDPAGYALMGLLLLAAGLAARRLTHPGGAQRGLSKKT